ncbi:MAG: YybH family protein [Candidatus Hodarchaeota archaeon]
MKTRCLISLMFLAAFMLMSQPALADDLADLKATHMTILKALNTGDVKTIFEYWQEGAIWFPDECGFVWVTKKAPGIKMFTKFFETYTLRTRWYKADYRVIGNTGLVWGLKVSSVRNKTTGVGRRTFVRTSLVFMKSEGKWLVVMEHNSQIPEKVELF